MKRDETEVLVVGAGPVGLLAANLLAQLGIKVQIIDAEERTAARSYACALHPATLRLLDSLGLATAVLEQGQRISKIAFYDGPSRRAEIVLSDLVRDFPFLLVLPQNALEDILEQHLLQKHRVGVNWNHRFDTFQGEEDALVTTIEKLQGTAVGYIVPHWETMVQKRFPLRSKFLVGADGHNSLVRRRLEIEYERLTAPHLFFACEFTSDAEPEDELRVILDETTTNVLWPLPGGKFRWTFELVHSDLPDEFPEKERWATRSGEKALNEKIRASLQRIIHHRAPWFSAEIKEILWCKQVMFEGRLAKQFGRDRCWLVGDAAHQTGPVGVQSLNVGMRETQTLATRIQKIIRDEAPLEELSCYDREQHSEWQRLLSGLKPRNETNPWVRKRADRLLPCLPASGEDMKRLAGQLGLEYNGSST
jgi:2-polyprenyl-6-methoxyphenol hydroxylase-like FAD-dependent oxidoreductase